MDALVTQIVAPCKVVFREYTAEEDIRPDIIYGDVSVLVNLDISFVAAHYCRCRI